MNPSDPTQAVLDRELRWKMVVFLIPFATLFPLVGLGAFYAFWKILRSPTNADGTDRVDPNPEEILSEARGAGAYWALAMFWNLLSFPIAILFLSEAKRHGPMVWIVMIFPAAGVYLVYLAVRGSIRWRRHGQLRLRLTPPQPLLGERLAGTIRFDKAPDDFGEILLALRCEYVYRINKTQQTDTLWSDERRVHRVGDTISFQFDLPQELPASTTAIGKHHRWVLYASTPDETLDRSFTITVAAPKAQTASFGTLAGLVP